MAQRHQSSLWTEIRGDLEALLTIEMRDRSLRSFLWAIFGMDAFMILALFRVRKWAVRWHIPAINRLLRGLALALYGIELGIDIQLGTGVYFVHSAGTVVGGKAILGNRVYLYGSNTIGAAHTGGEPTIGDDVKIGAGARVLGPISIGAHVVIGANAVVLSSLSSGATAVGIPARVVAPKGSQTVTS